MRSGIRSFFTLRPILVGLALFNLMWMVMREINLRQDYAQGLTGSHVFPGLYYDQILFSFILFITCLPLLLNKKWRHAAAFVLSGFIFWDTTLRKDIWGSWETIGLPIHTFKFLKHWWFFYGHELLNLTLSGVIAATSVISILRLMIQRNRPGYSRPTRLAIPSHE